MDRQQLIKLGLLAIALVGLVYVINLYSKKQNVVSNGHMDGFDDHEVDPDAPTENYTEDDACTTSDGEQGKENAQD